MVEHIEVGIDELMLDEDNPRLGSSKGQADALEIIFNLNSNHFRNLMKSIKVNGLDPGDSFYVIAGAIEGDFIVLEGNRRTAALKVLANPDVLESTGLSKTDKSGLRRISADFDRTSVEPIRCVEFESREEAHDWIFRRHTGTVEGEGRIQWGPLEIQKFSGDRSTLDILEFIGRNAGFEKAEWDSTKRVIESGKSSTLSRLLQSDYGQRHIGITFTKDDPDRTPLLISEPHWAINVLKKIIMDVRDGQIDSRSINKSSDIQNYFRTFPKDLQPNENRVTPKAFKDIDIVKQGTQQKAAPTPPTKTTTTPRARKTLAPKKHPFELPVPTKGQNLRREAQTLDADKFPISSAFLLRAFIELALDEYMIQNKLSKIETNKSGATVELNMTQIAERVIQHIQKYSTFSSSDLRGFRNNILQKTSPISIQSLNGFVHNRFQTPSGSSLRAGWDCSVPIFICAFGSA